MHTHVTPLGHIYIQVCKAKLVTHNMDGFKDKKPSEAHFHLAFAVAFAEKNRIVFAWTTPSKKQ